MPVPFDRRLTPARPDLAAMHLKGQVEATRFVEGRPMVVHAAVTPMRREPRFDAMLETEAIAGETVTVYDTDAEGWCWGQLATDGYVGYLPVDDLTRPGPTPTHKVAVPRSPVFPGLSIKLPPRTTLPMGARVAVARIEGSFAVLTDGNALPASHLLALDAAPPTDPVAVARRFLETPYLWGGRTAFGIDCSGLVQTAAHACGLTCPRDSDLQEQAFGTAPPPDDPASLEPGTLVFFAGHVGIVSAPGRFLHANAFHMQVAEEDLAGALTRIAAAGAPARRVGRVGLNSASPSYGRPNAI